jgi:hypothetical protein
MALVPNRDAGNAWTAHILGELFANWPRRCDFDFLTVSSKTDVEPRDDAVEVFDDLLLWLRAEGFISFEQTLEGNAFDVALTMQGFTALGRQPEGIDKPLGEKMKEAATAAGVEMRGAVISDLVGRLIVGAMAAISGSASYAQNRRSFADWRMRSASLQTAARYSFSAITSANLSTCSGPGTSGHTSSSTSSIAFSHLCAVVGAGLEGRSGRPVRPSNSSSTRNGRGRQLSPSSPEPTSPSACCSLFPAAVSRAL